ncbi:hypothetical protein SISNIDRAFT_455373 [Sistotremastrum niveocremeum HHB9708]|uniref:Uncharacterized protein n=1 Tax=Sistotremastrum niveocremeum HHB9708 TaxID=1314777 RepID=A0A164TYY6_9AGAM|nr:hypothetical protein SISNIDRAFT_455373 [Sistotremastrum niveocremeum HHB9708]
MVVRDASCQKFNNLDMVRTSASLEWTLPIKISFGSTVQVELDEVFSPKIVDDCVGSFPSGVKSARQLLEQAFPVHVPYTIGPELADRFQALQSFNFSPPDSTDLIPVFRTNGDLTLRPLPVNIQPS